MKYQEKTKEELVAEIESLKSDISEFDRYRLKRLKESEDKFKTVFDNAIDGIYIVKLDSRKTYNANETFCKMLGYSLLELMDMGVEDLHPKNELPYVMEQFEKQYNLESPLAREIPVRRKDGSIFYADISASPITIGGEKYMMGIFRDISERKDALDWLRENERRYRKQNETLAAMASLEISEAPDVETVVKKITEMSAKTLNVDRVSVWLFNRDKIIFRCVDLFELATGEHSSGQELRSADYPEYFRALSEERSIAADDAHRDKRTKEFSEEYMIPLGISSMLEAPVRLGSELLGVICHEHVGEMREWELDEESFAASLADTVSLSIETIQRKEAERGLAEAQRVAGLGSWEWEVSSGAFTFSEEFGRIFKVDEDIDIKDLIDEGGAEEITARAYLSKVHPDDRRDVLDLIASALSGEAHASMEHRIIVSGGTERFINLDAEARYDNTGEAIRLVGTVKDITEQSKTNAERLKTQKLESLELFAGGIAHDFNNILGGILGNISMMEITLDPSDKLQNYIEVAKKATLRARDLTKQLLNFSKEGSPTKEAASIGELVTDAAEFASKGSSAKYEYDVPAGLWSVEVDCGQISQVINNLVINARQAMSGGGVVRLKAENIDVKCPAGLPLRLGKYVKVSVEDEGTGIKAENLKKIFDPYFTTKETGTGLGLATSYSIIKKHDGLLTAESDYGLGTIFSFYLPAYASVTEDVEMFREPIFTNKGRVLVMDDDDNLLSLSCQALPIFGYDVEPARSGVEAIEKYKAAAEAGNPFDVVIMDITIPGGMGAEATIKKLLEIDPDVKAIVSSGYYNSPIMDNYERAGFKGRVDKPYTFEDLSRKLSDVVRNKDAHSEAV